MVYLSTNNQPVERRQAQSYLTSSNKNSSNDVGWRLWKGDQGQRILTTSIPIFQVRKWRPRQESKVTQLVSGQVRIFVVGSLTLDPHTCVTWFWSFTNGLRIISLMCIDTVFTAYLVFCLLCPWPTPRMDGMDGSECILSPSSLLRKRDPFLHSHTLSKTPQCSWHRMGAYFLPKSYGNRVWDLARHLYRDCHPADNKLAHSSIPFHHP